MRCVVVVMMLQALLATGCGEAEENEGTTLVGVDGTDGTDGGNATDGTDGTDATGPPDGTDATHATEGTDNTDDDPLVEPIEDLGLPCGENLDCKSEYCVETPSGGVCSQECVTECPEGWNCKAVTSLAGPDLLFLCVPDGDPGPGPGPDPDQKLACILDNCNVGSCTEFEPCALALECMAKCEDADCAIECAEAGPPPAQNLLFNISQCALQHECLSDAPPPPPGPECGNGKCEPGEDPQSCPDDCENVPPPPGDSCEGKCGQFQDNAPCQCDDECAQYDDCCDDYEDVCDGPPPPPPELECIVNNCNTGQCLNVDQCADALFCMADCETVECAAICAEDGPGGPAQNLLFNVLECGAEAGCWEGGPPPPPGFCGDEICDGPETPGNCPEDCGGGGGGSCEGKCDAEFQPGAPCQCDFQCTQFGDCCEDYKDVCDGGGGCLIESCNTGQCLNFPVCANAVACMEACETPGCAEGCIDDAPGAAKPVLNSVLECGIDAGCYEEEYVGTETFQCLVEGCDTGGCLDFDGCTGVLICMGDCDKADCAEDCVASAPGPAKELLSGVLGCGVEIGCLEGGDPPEGGALECVDESCAIGFCAAIPFCNEVLECLDECKSTECAEGCASGVGGISGQLVKPIISCGAAAGCWSAPEPTDPAICIFNQCNGQVAGCTASYECTQALACVEDCKGSASCAKGCADGLPAEAKELLAGVLDCGTDKGCLE